MIGKVGNDPFGKQLRSGLKQAGVDVSAVGHVDDSSGVAVIVVSPEGDNVIVVTPGANAALRPVDLDANLEMIRNARVVLTQLETPMETVEHLAELCEHEGVPLILDPAPSQKLSPALMMRVSWFTPNETEALFYAQAGTKEPPQTIAGRLFDEGAAGVVLTLGSSGIYLRDREGLDVLVPAFSVNAVDTTAAGDAFNGAFAVGLALGHSPENSARFAAAAAAISVTRPGAQPSMPTFMEVTKMLDGADCSRIPISGV
jgi:ribokinase